MAGITVFQSLDPLNMIGFIIIPVCQYCMVQRADDLNYKAATAATASVYPQTILMSNLMTISGMLPLKMVLLLDRNCIKALQAVLLTVCWKVRLLQRAWLRASTGKSAMLENLH